jgi:tRNA-specific 2-thiouridylase
MLFAKGDFATISFSRPQWAVAPGQAIVFYKDEEVLGGGIIEGSKIAGSEEEHVATAKP